MGDLHPATLLSMVDLASLLNDIGQYKEAEPLYREALDGMRTSLGSCHPHTLLIMRNLAIVLKRMGQHEGAERLRQEALEVEEHGTDPTSSTGTTTTTDAIA